MSSTDQTNKAHKTRVTGAKHAKKEQHRKERLGLDTQPNRGRNNKAFTGPGQGSHKVHAAQRALEKKSAHVRMPVEDKQNLGLADEPPLLVAVVGPPGCGKTTLIRSMAKYYANRNIQRLRGPVTVVAGRSRRVTFVEVPNTLSAMCDMAKIADLVIIMVDGSFGFEMETFEFLNIAQIHGFPRVMGVVSHLDKMKTNKQLKRTKRLLRHRFWHEVAEGCKLVCLAPMINGMYRSSDVLKLHRLLVNTNPKVQNWKNSHGCVLLDRFEDITDAAELERSGDKCDRTIAFYGYVRGHAIKPGQAIHIPGVGDFDIAHMSRQEDPCSGVVHNDKSAGNRLRHLSTKHKKIYAPHCDLGGVVFDEDAVYVHEDADRQNTSRSGEGLEMLRDLQRVKAIDEQLDDDADDADAIAAARRAGRRPMQFTNPDALEMDVGPIASGSDDDDDDDDGSEYDDAPGCDPLDEFGHLDKRGGNDAGYDDDDDDEDGEGLAPRHPHAPDTVIVEGMENRFDWSDPVYTQKLKSFFVTGAWTKAERGDDDSDDGEAAADDDDDSKGYESVDEDDVDMYNVRPGDGDDDSEDDSSSDGGEAAQRAAPTGRKVGVKSGRGGGAPPPLEAGDSDDDDEGGAAAGGGIGQSDAEVQGLLDFFIEKDLKTDAKAADFMDEITGGGAAAAGGEFGDAADAEEAKLVAAHGDGSAEVDDYIKKKMAKKKAFDAQYDEGGVGGSAAAAAGKNNSTAYYQSLLDEQAQKRRALEETLDVVGEDIDKRISLVGFFGGLYVRFVIKRVPMEFVRKFDPTVPLFAGALNAGEERMGIVTGRLKRHRWYPKILKAQDPVVLSMGWRRIQTQPIFAIDDPNGRHRYLKYSPKHMHCLVSFYGPTTPTNTGFVVIPVKNTRSEFFRLTASGYTTGMDANTQIVKKLKLTGVPEKIQKTVCFVKGMFNSDIEAAKFIGAKVKAVSGLRGIIKKVLKGKGGLVRCSFEDKLLKSDIVFLRSWKAVDPPRYCVNVLNALNPEWEGMRTMRELRRDLNLPFDHRPESEYKEIKRRNEPKNEPVNVAVSRALRMNLPFEHKEDYIAVQQTEKGVAKRAKALATAAPEPHELKKQALLDALSKKDADMSAHQKALRANARHKASVQHKKEAAKMDKKIKEAKKESAKRAEFKAQHKSRAAAGKKR